MAWSISEVDIYNDEYQLCCTRRSHHISYSERADAHHWQPFPRAKLYDMQHTIWRLAVFDCSGNKRVISTSQTQL